ncbi:hypothetical protein FOA43_004679 [Brettanomyces nanus]|uniref:G-patch domain-containing protein n=1 Tax=Eeniella nana TaxID=13502 RepID=A0A875S6R1_EENNA|nr:uncharacterized protein FOA43_004679 [Brettanomyces nanus]QPG77271.1 hypothetical protein FOA43_004679 [Brettanomyces nanus]
MDSKQYLRRYGWKEGEALQQGGLQKPLLVKHKYDLKGVGQDSKDGEVWWERLFDGQLKALDVSNVNGKIGQECIRGIMPTMFNSNAGNVVASGMEKSESPLYRMFVLGEVLEGTMEKSKGRKMQKTDAVTVATEEISEIKEKKSRLVFFDVSFDETTHSHKRRHEKEKKCKRKHKLARVHEHVHEHHKQKSKHKHEHHHKHK